MKDEEWIEENVEIVVSDGFGIYVPQVFTERFDRETASVEDWEIVKAGPEDNEWYWEAWAAIESSWEDSKGRTIFHNGDVFLIGPNAPDGVWEMLAS